MALKRRIDKSNQDRTDLVELIDSYFLDKYKEVKPLSDATINTESPAWAIDRLSILALKIYHMQQEVERTDTTEEHRLQCHYTSSSVYILSYIFSRLRYQLITAH